MDDTGSRRVTMGSNGSQNQAIAARPPFSCSGFLGALALLRVREHGAEPLEPQLQVGFLIVDGVYNTELTAPFDMFHHTVFHADAGMRVFTVAPSLLSERVAGREMP